MAHGGSGNAGDRDDEIERRLRELTAEVSAASRIREPSAAERAFAAERAARAAMQERPVKHRRRRGLLTTWVIVLVVVAAGGVLAWNHYRSSPSALNDTRPVRNGPVPASSASVVSTPSAPVSPPADPFTGTPADRWAGGTAGIVVPSARAHGEFTTAQVQAAWTRRVSPSARVAG